MDIAKFWGGQCDGPPSSKNKVKYPVVFLSALNVAKQFSESATCGAIQGVSMPKFMCVKDANGSQLREIWKTTAILSTELLKNHTTENHRCLWDNPAQLSTYIMDPELIWALW